MTSEIGATRPLPPTGSRPPPSAATELAIKLLQPLQGLLASGEQVQAEVISLREQQQSFQVLLKMTLANGRQATLPATSNQPLPEGTRLTLTAVSEQRLSATLQAGLDTALTRLNSQAAPTGSLLQARVISSELQAAGKSGQNLYRVLASLLTGQLAGQQIKLDSPQPLPIGSLLSARVIDSQTLQFLPPSAQLDSLEIQQQLNQQQSRQTSLEALLKPLNDLISNNKLTPDLQKTASQLLNQLPDFKQLQNPEHLSKAMAGSGSFFEAHLLSPNAQQSLPQDLKGNLLRLVAQLLPQLPAGSPLSSPLGASLNVNLLTQALPTLLRGMLGGAAPGKASTAGFPLPARLLTQGSEDADLEALLKLAAAAVSRLQTHQLSSLGQSQTLADGSQLTTWQMEIPLRQAEGFTSLQVKIEQEQSPAQQKNGQPQTLWRVDLAFNLEPLGALQVQAQLLRGCFSSQLWAERASTAQLANAELPWLRERLNAAGFSVGELACQQGVPPQGPRTQLQQRWIDEKA